MTAGDDADSPDAVSGAPLDATRLDVIYERVTTDDRFVQVDKQPEYAPARLVCAYDTHFYPSSVQQARLEIAWFENGDFSLHYHEDHDEGVFDHRWDRHPSDHNARDHIHPGPDAPTPGQDASHPDDWRDVLAEVLEDIEARQRAFWEGSNP